MYRINNYFTHKIHILSNSINKLYYNISIIVYVLLLVILLLYAVCIGNQWENIHVWRPDSIYYLQSYWYKFCTEGRWINYLFFPILKVIPPHISLLCSYIIIFYYFFICARPFVPWHYAVLFALGGIQISSLNDLLTWPVSGLTSFLILGCCTYLRGKVGWYLVFALGGVFFNGALNNFYNLLPLLYLRELSEGKISFFRFLGCYIGCFLIGFVCCQTIVFLASGSPIQIAAWRSTHYIHNIHDLSSNIIRIFGFLKAHCMFGVWPLLACTALVVLGLLSLSLSLSLSLRLHGAGCFVI